MYIHFHFYISYIISKCVSLVVRINLDKLNLTEILIFVVLALIF